MLLDEPPEPGEQPAALGGGGGAPRAGEGGPRRGDGGVDLGRAAAGDHRELAPGRGVDRRQGAGLRRHPGAADQAEAVRHADISRTGEAAISSRV